MDFVIVYYDKKSVDANTLWKHFLKWKGEWNTM